MTDDNFERETKSIKNDRKWLNVGVFAGPFVMLVLLVLWAFLGKEVARIGGADGTIGAAGTFGDSFGALNTLFASFAMIATVAALSYQVLTLREQSVELGKQERRYHDDRREQRKNQFEAAFFQLLQLSREVKTQGSFRHSEAYMHEAVTTRQSGLLRGDEAISALLREYDFWWDRGIDGEPVDNRIQDHPRMIYDETLSVNSENSISAYFRTLQAILRRIYGDTALSEAEKVEYANLLRDQLSPDDLATFALATTSERSNEALAFAKYRFLAHLPKSHVVKKYLGGHYGHLFN